MAEKDCEKALDLLNEYIDGELCASDAEFVRSHTESCPKCRKALEELEKIKDLFSENLEEAPSELHDRVMEQVRAEKADSRKKIIFMRKFSIIAVAAVICLSVLASPMLIMLASGGAKAEDGALDFLEDALAPNLSGKDDVKNDYPQSCDKEESFIKDSVDSDAENEILLVDSGAYTAIMLDGSERVLKLDTSNLVALFDTEEYALEVKGFTYTLTNKDGVLKFTLITENTAYFKQID